MSEFNLHKALRAAIKTAPDPEASAIADHAFDEISRRGQDTVLEALRQALELLVTPSYIAQAKATPSYIAKAKVKADKAQAAKAPTRRQSLPTTTLEPPPSPPTTTPQSPPTTPPVRKAATKKTSDQPAVPLTAKRRFATMREFSPERNVWILLSEATADDLMSIANARYAKAERNRSQGDWFSRSAKQVVELGVNVLGDLPDAIQEELLSTKGEE